MREWRPVSRKERCPVCDGADWCAISTDNRVARCMRVVDGPDVVAREDRDGVPYGLRFLDDSTPPAARDLSRYSKDPAADRADPDALHRAYSALLAAMPLSLAHHRALRARGLDDAAIAERGYRTMPPRAERGRVLHLLRKALESGSADGSEKTEKARVPAGVPGLHGGKLSGAEGLAIPVRDGAGRVVAVKIRADDPGEGRPKYTWLSSAPDGPSPGSQCHVPVPADAGGSPSSPAPIRVTEGPLKADIATHLSGTRTLGVGGCLAARSAVPHLRALGCARVLVAWDADARDNPAVARGLEMSVRVFREEGFEVAVETWDPACGKGIDDALSANAKVTVHEGAAVDRVVAQIVEAAGAAGPARARPAASPPASPAPSQTQQPQQPRPVFDRGDAVELAHALLGGLRSSAPSAGGDAVVFDRGSLWQYDPSRGVYVERTRAECYQFVSAYAGAPCGPKGAPLKLSDGAIKGAVFTAQQLAARPGYFDTAPKGVVFADRFATARGGEVVTAPHSHEHRATHTLAVAYEMDAPRHAWTGMLREIFRRRDEDGRATAETEADTEACIALLQEWIGTALLGDATSRAVSLVLVGAGNDGKSSILNVLRALFPATAVCSIAPQDWARGFLLAGLAGKRLNVVAELPERDILDSERFKAVVDGSPLTAERKNQDPFDLVCEAAHLFACNALPATRDQSRGFWRRFIVLVCERSFEAHEVVRDLWRKVVADELAGIAAWALDGAARAQAQQELTAPDSSIAAKADWQYESDQVRQFVSEACVAAEGDDRAGLADLFTAYRLWCAQSGHPPLARNRLGSRLRGLGYEHRTKLARVYKLKVSASWLARSSQGGHQGGQRASLN